LSFSAYEKPNEDEELKTKTCLQKLRTNSAFYIKAHFREL
jgi:hypothetical protein